MMQRAGIRLGFMSICALVFMSSVASQVTGSGTDQTSPKSQDVSAPPAAMSADAHPVAPANVLRSPLGQATDLFRKGDFDAAIKKYQEIIAEKPKSPDAYAGLVRCYLKQKDVKQANETVTRALAVSDAWPVRVALGEVYFRQGKIPEAEKEWVAVINAGHQSARAYLGVARVRRALSLYKSAKTMIDNAHELDPGDPDIQRFWIGTLPSSQRIQYYESYLAEGSIYDDDDRRHMERYLSFLKNRAKQPDRPCRMVSKVTNTTTPLVRLMTDSTHLRGYGLAVDLNGTHANIMLDTGASGITVNRRLAERAGITKITETKIWGVGDKDSKNAFVGTAKSIRIGQLEFQDCPVGVIESRSVAGEDGLIGADVFEHFLVEIDFPGEKLKLSELPKRPGEADRTLMLKSEEDDSEEDDEADKTETTSGDGTAKTAPVAKTSGPQDRYIAPEMQSYARVYRFGHALQIPTKVGDVPGKLFLMDTGAQTNAISPEAAREVTKVQGDPNITVKGLSGSVKNVYSANKAVLQFGHLRQENQDMMSFDIHKLSDSEGIEISGFLGFVLLRFLDIKIDYRDGLVDFAYDPKKFGRY
jgi:tetratricopeptide (TPR) repeat protein